MVHKIRIRYRFELTEFVCIGIILVFYFFLLFAVIFVSNLEVIVYAAIFDLLIKSRQFIIRFIILLASKSYFDRIIFLLRLPNAKLESSN